MRYRLDSMLPEQAFQPRGKGPFARGMTLEGGGGGIAKATESVVTGKPMQSSGGGGGGGKGGGFNPITTIVTIVVAVAAPEILPAIVPELTATEATMIGVGVTRAATTAAQGGNLEQSLKAGAIGAASAGVGAEVSSAVGGGVLPGETGDIPYGGVSEATGSTLAGKVSGGAAGGATTGFTQAELSGSNLQQAGKSALVGGATGAALGALGEGLKEAGATPTETRLASTLAGPYIAQDVRNLFYPQQSAQTVGGGGAGPTSQPLGSPITGQVTPGSQALGQALGVYTGDISPPVQIGGEEGKSRPVWNIASLKVKDETGSSA